MAIIDGLLQELEQEAQTTKRVLERVPQEHLGWKPHPKSYSLGQLALHIAQVPGNVAELAMQSPATPPAFVQEQAKTSAELVPTLEQSVAKAKSVLAGLERSGGDGTWRLVAGDRELMALPRAAFLRTVMLNHWYHHRGQLTVYLRQLNVPVPSVYGPSADENPFAAAMQQTVVKKEGSTCTLHVPKAIFEWGRPLFQSWPKPRRSVLTSLRRFFVSRRCFARGLGWFRLAPRLGGTSALRIRSTRPLARRVAILRLRAMHAAVDDENALIGQPRPGEPHQPQLDLVGQRRAGRR